MYKPGGCVGGTVGVTGPVTVTLGPNHSLSTQDPFVKLTSSKPTEDSRLTPIAAIPKNNTCKKEKLVMCV